MSLQKEMNKTIRFVIATVGLLVLMLLAHPILTPFFSSKEIYPLYLMVGFFGSAVCFAVFHQGWLLNISELTMQRLFIAGLFFTVGSLQIIHTISYARIHVPFFHFDVDTSLWLHMTSRALCAIGLLVIYGMRDRIVNPCWKRTVLTVSIMVTLLACIVATLFHTGILKWVNEARTDGVLPILNVSIFAIYIMLAALLLQRFKTTAEPGYLMILRGAVCCAVAELCYMLTGELNDTHHFVGMSLNVIAFYYVLKGVYKLTFEPPLRQKEDAQKQVEMISFYDVVTGMANRRQLKVELEKSMQIGVTGLLVLNVDRFRYVNDTLGHHVGNLLLQSIGDRLLANCRMNEEAFHLGGDEFAVLLTNFVDEESSLHRIRELRKEVQSTVTLKGIEYKPSISVGIALFPLDGDTADDLIQHAVTAAHNAKKMVCEYLRYSNDVQIKAQEKMQLENDMRKGLERSEFFVVYQPRVQLESEHIVGMEALVRWNHPTRGLIFPAEFIPIAEESGLIIPLGEFVLREACRQNRDWQREGYAPICVSVNLSMGQFKQNNLVHTVRNILKETGLQPRHLELEITESMTFDKDAAFEQLCKIKELGVEISIDDFGTGYSSLHYLKDLPIDRLKIDRSFLDEVLQNTNNAAIISTITSMAHHLKLQVTAEGVENEEQLHFLREQRCNEGQGYLFSKPLAAVDFERQFLSKVG